MKRIIIILSSIAAIASLCLAIDDATSKTETKDNKELTTFQRNGTNILRRIQYKSDDPSKRILRQHILMGDLKVAEIVDFQGKQTCNVETNLPVTFGILHSSTGGLESVVLTDDAHGIVEAYECKNGCLVPISGSNLKQARELTKDVSGFIDDVKAQKKSPEELKGQVMGIMLKQKLRELHNKAIDSDKE
jgi:hypothetical protein